MSSVNGNGRNNGPRSGQRPRSDRTQSSRNSANASASNSRHQSRTSSQDEVTRTPAQRSSTMPAPQPRPPQPQSAGREPSVDLSSMSKEMECPGTLEPLLDPVTVRYESKGHDFEVHYDREFILTWINQRQTEGLPPTDPLSHQTLLNERDSNYPDLRVPTSLATQVGDYVFARLSPRQQDRIRRAERAGESRNRAMEIVIANPNIGTDALLDKLRPTRPNANQQEVIRESMRHGVTEQQAMSFVMEPNTHATVQDVVRNAFQTNVDRTNITFSRSESEIVDNATDGGVPRRFAVRYIAAFQQRDSSPLARQYLVEFNTSYEDEATLRGLYFAAQRAGIIRLTAPDLVIVNTAADMGIPLQFAMRYMLASQDQDSNPLARRYLASINAPIEQEATLRGLSLTAQRAGLIRVSVPDLTIVNNATDMGIPPSFAMRYVLAVQNQSSSPSARQYLTSINAPDEDEASLRGLYLTAQRAGVI